MLTSPKRLTEAEDCAKGHYGKYLSDIGSLLGAQERLTK
jgi:hypothetical protein